MPILQRFNSRLFILALVFVVLAAMVVIAMALNFNRDYDQQLAASATMWYGAYSAYQTQVQNVTATNQQVMGTLRAAGLKPNILVTAQAVQATAAAMATAFSSSVPSD